MTDRDTRLERRIRRDFAEPGSVVEVLRLLSELAGHFDGYLGSERVQAAIVLLAGGDIGRFRQVLELGRMDWRDVLVAAGLADEDWSDRLDHELGPAETAKGPSGTAPSS